MSPRQAFAPRRVVERRLFVMRAAEGVGILAQCSQPQGANTPPVVTTSVFDVDVAAQRPAARSRSTACLASSATGRPLCGTAARLLIRRVSPGPGIATQGLRRGSGLSTADARAKFVDALCDHAAGTGVIVRRHLGEIALERSKLFPQLTTIAVHRDSCVARASTVAPAVLRPRTWTYDHLLVGRTCLGAKRRR